MKFNKIICIASGIAGALLLGGLITVIVKKVCGKEHSCYCLPCCGDNDDEMSGNMNDDTTVCKGGQKKEGPEGN